MSGPNKSLGQHWLKDRYILDLIAESAELHKDDTVLEIGPGLGTLTSVLLRDAGGVVAVEFDGELARKLPNQFPGKNLAVYSEDILSFDLNLLPPGYKAVANVPYYITSKIVQLLSESKNPPSLAVLLVQKEVAQRLAAAPGSMSTMSIAAQVFHEVSLGVLVEAQYFTPPPKVDSQVIVMKRRQESLLTGIDEKLFFRVVHAGFSERRKKLRSSLSGGLGITKDEADALLKTAEVSLEARAQELSIDEWRRIVSAYDTSRSVH